MMDIFSYKINPVSWDSRLRELEEFLQKPIAAIEKEYLDILDQEKALESSLYQSQGYDENLSAYYSRTNRYLYELMRWEASLDKEHNFSMLYLFLKKNKVKKILDFGGGIGGLPIYLTERGIQSDYSDIDGITSRFAEWRFEKWGLNIRQIEVGKNLPQEEYDAVISYDVLEHLPEIEGSIKKITASLKSRGFLLSKSTFSGGGLHLKKNEVYSDIRKFNELLKNCGLEYLGRIKKSFPAQFFQGIGIKKITGVRVSRKMKSGGNFLVHRKCS